jgi:hypothetical protein
MEEDIIAQSLKCHPKYFQAILDGRKTFEIRRDDRGIVTDDIIRLREWDPETQSYTGRDCLKKVTYMYRERLEKLEPPGEEVCGLRLLSEDVCVFSIADPLPIVCSHEGKIIRYYGEVSWCPKCGAIKHHKDKGWQHKEEGL